VRDVLPRAGKEIVETDDLVPVVEERSHRWEPMNPAPPVTSVRLGLVYV
jgi:hypothetical protein